MIEYNNSDGHLVSINGHHLVELLYLDRHTSSGGTGVYGVGFSDSTKEPAEDLVKRWASEVPLAQFTISIDTNTSIPVWLNAKAVTAVREVLTGHSVIITETGTSTTVVEPYKQV